MGPAELDDRELGYIDLLCSAFFFLVDSRFLLFLSSFFFFLPCSFFFLLSSFIFLVPSWLHLGSSWLHLGSSWLPKTPAQSFPKKRPPESNCLLEQKAITFW